MNQKDQDLDQVIASLNTHPNIAQVAAANLENFDYTVNEKYVLQKFLPENALIVYGSLAPGKPNHHVVEHIKGKWLKGIVRGRLESMGWGAAMGYNGFRHTHPSDQVKITAHILISPALKSNWARLDEFEGTEYRRILAKYELESGEAGLGFIYAINEEFR